MAQKLDLSRLSYSDDEDSIQSHESSNAGKFSCEYNDDVSWESAGTPNFLSEFEGSSQRTDAELNNQKDLASAVELNDLQDVSFLFDLVSGLRNDRWEFSHLNWENHVTQLEHEGLFVNEYLMSVTAHSKLVRILHPFLQRSEFNSCCNVPILVEHIVAVGLRVLSGGRPKDQRHIIGSSRAAAYVAFDDFVEAVNLAPELDIVMPQTPQEWDIVYNQYKSKSTNEIMAGCVGAIDGFFQRTKRPSSKEAPNVLAYYSGHYE